MDLKACLPISEAGAGDRFFVWNAWQDWLAEREPMNDPPTAVRRLHQTIFDIFTNSFSQCALSPAHFSSALVRRLRFAPPR